MDKEAGLHIVVLPWIHFSHLHPFLHLSRRIAQLGHRISFLSIPSLIQSLAASHSDLPPLVHLVPLHSDIHDDALEAAVAAFLESASPPPDWILFDSITYWVPCVAARFGVPCAFVCLIGAAASAISWTAVALAADGGQVKPEHLAAPPGRFPFPTSLAYRPHEARQVVRDMFEPNQLGASWGSRGGSAIRGCDVVAIRSSPELEPEWLALLEPLYRKPVLALGHFPPTAPTKTDPECDYIFEWLGKREAGTVVYVALGTSVSLNEEQVREIARGLELSELPFLWVLRSSESEKDTLPHETRGRGLVWKGWVPQVRILGHPSVGGFLTHCGWSSLVEGLQFGLALVLLPLAYDQGLNARLMVDKKVGAEVPRNEEDGSFVGEDIARTVRLVMVDREGEGCRMRAKELGGVLGSKEMHDSRVRNFVEYLESNRREARPPA